MARPALLTLLMAAGLLLRGLIRAVTMDPGFETKKVLFLELNLDYSAYTQARAEQFQRDLRARLAALPGVQSVVPGGSPLSDYPPFRSLGWRVMSTPGG